MSDALGAPSSDADGQPVSPEPETVTYQFEVPVPLWEGYKSTLSHELTVKRSMLRLLAGAAIGGSGEGADLSEEFDGVVIDRDLWATWADTIPRSQSIDDHLSLLIERDVEASRKALNGDGVNEASVGLLAQRIRIRATQALGAVRDAEEVDRETAIDQLEDVIDLADALEQ